MKILHTADWHLGQNFYGYSRMEEHRAFFSQLGRIAAEERPDAMVVCGDIFHNYTPSAEAQRLFTDSLVAIHQACPEMQIIVTAGNHDSASRLEVDCELWRLANVHVVGQLPLDAERQPDFRSILFPIADKGYVVALPYIFEQAYPPDPDGGDAKKWFFTQLEAFVDSINDGRPTVLMAHLAVSGSELHGQRIRERMTKGKDLSDNIGGLDCIAVDAFGSAFDYVALGHIHHPQTVRGSHGHVRYAGSPVAVSFDEDYPHSVSVVEVEHGRKPSVREAVIDNPCPLLTVPTQPKPTGEAIEALRTDVPRQGKCYVCLNPEEDNFFPISMEEDAIRTLHEVNTEACYATFKPNLKHSAAIAAQPAEVTPEELVAMQPIDVAKEYFARRGEDFKAYEDLFRQVMDRIEKEGTL